MFVWRRKMGTGYFEALVTPMQVIVNDLEFMSLENEYGQKKPEQPKGNKK